MAKGKTRGVYLSDDTWKSLENASKEDDRSVNWLISLFVKTGIESRKSIFPKQFKRKVSNEHHKG